MNRFRLFVVAAIVALAGCSSTLTTPSPVPTSSNSPPPPSSPIQHVIVLFQENRSFDNLFMSFPGADTTTMGACKPFTPPGSSHTYCPNGDPVPLKPITLETCKCHGGTDLDHGHAAFESEVDEDPVTHVLKMDGFDTINTGTGGLGIPAGLYPYAYVVRRETKPYWDMASQYTLADHMFSTETTDSFVAHQEIIAGTVALNSHESLTDVPSNQPWGCDAPHGTTTSLILTNGTVHTNGPFPCFTQYGTMADVLDAANVSWKYYVSEINGIEFSGNVWDAFDAIKKVRYGPDWKKITNPSSAVLTDIKKGSLPQVSWVIPTLLDSDHPASGCNDGPPWVSSVVNAVGKSAYWKNTAIVLLWDDWGGFYDNVPPKQIDYTSLGIRVPMIVISPFAKPHHVSQTDYEFGSILKFIEQNFGTGSLGTSDVRATSIADAFDFGQKPVTFRTISAPRPTNCLNSSAQYFLKSGGALPD